MKKILIIMQSLDGGGAEKVLIDILKYFNLDIYNVSICLLDKGGVYLKDIPKNIELLPYFHHSEFYMPVKKVSRKLNLMNAYYSMERFFFRKFIKIEYDIVISFMEGQSLKYHSFIFDRCKKNISWVHINFNLNHWSSTFFKNHNEEELIYNLLSCIVFVSNDAKAEFNKLFKITHPSQKVIYNLIDRNNILNKSNKEDIEKHKFTICCVGRLYSQKRFDRAINVAKILKDKGFDFELWILGIGPLELDLKNQVKALGLTNFVKFWGFIKNPYPIMKKSDLYLMTSDTEGYPLVICEAICLGLPIVSTNITGVNEILDDGTYGVLTSFKETEIANILSELITNPIKLNNLSLLSQERARIFNPQNTMSEIYELLENTI